MGIGTRFKLDDASMIEKERVFVTGNTASDDDFPVALALPDANEDSATRASYNFC